MMLALGVDCWKTSFFKSESFSTITINSLVYFVFRVLVAVVTSSIFIGQCISAQLRMMTSNMTNNWLNSGDVLPRTGIRCFFQTISDELVDVRLSFWLRVLQEQENMALSTQGFREHPYQNRWGILVIGGGLTNWRWLGGRSGLVDRSKTIQNHRGSQGFKMAYFHNQWPIIC